MSDVVMDAMSAMAAEGRPADLVASGLVKVYGDRTVVSGMNVQCSCGEIVGILGPNGAGKTTTFYMVVGLVKPEAGKVVFRGEDAAALEGTRIRFWLDSEQIEVEDSRISTEQKGGGMDFL